MSKPHTHAKLAHQQLSKTNLLKMMELQYGNREVAQYYTRLIREAGNRAKIDLSNNNPASLAANVQTMIDNVEMLNLFLNDDKKEI